MNYLYLKKWLVLNAALLWITISLLQPYHGLHEIFGISTFAIGACTFVYAGFLFIIEGGYKENEEDDSHQALPQHPCPACRNKIGTVSEREQAGHRAQAQSRPVRHVVESPRGENDYESA